MRAPEMLPWIAKRAGIDELLALKLWRRAASEAEWIVGNHDSSRFFDVAVDRLIDLVDAEAGRNPVTTLPALWLWSCQTWNRSLALAMAENAWYCWLFAWSLGLCQAASGNAPQLPRCAVENCREN